MDVDKLEFEYTPSLSSKRFKTRDELYVHYNKFCAENSEKSRFQLNCHLNISYGETFREKLDIYGDDLPENSPLFVFIHGGYWQMCDKWNSAWFCETFVKKGIRVISVDYDLCPQVTLETIVVQLKKAFEWISIYVKKNSIKSLSIAGHSAGGHLLATSLTQDFLNSIESDVKIFNYFISGVYDLNELKDLKAANENNILSLDSTNCLQLSPQFFDFSFLQNFSVKNFLFAGEFESEKFREQSRNFAAIALKGNDVKFEVTKGVDHFDIVEKLREDDYEITKLIVQNAFQV